MSAQEIVTAIVDTLNIVISWPLVIFVLIFMFRKSVEEAIGGLTERLKSVSVGGATAEFRSVAKSLSGREDEAEGIEDQETLQGVDATDSPLDESTLREFDQQIENLRK